MRIGKGQVAAFVSGLLCTNSLPHLATAAAGRRHLTPLAGKSSGPVVNLVWGGANLAAGMALLARSARAEGGWDSRLVAFDAGAATFAAWMAVGESALKLNWTSEGGRDAAEIQH